MPEQIFTEITGTETPSVVYKIDNVDFASFGVFVMKSSGMQDMPSLKEPQTVDWPGGHGTVVDLAAPRYNNREIELECFIQASGKLDFFNKVRAFLQAFQKPELRRLDLWIADKPQIFMVYLADGVSIEKQWHESDMFGTFTLKLIDPLPVKRLLKVTGTSASITLTSSNPISIYWGDGAKTLDVFGTAVTKTHTYTSGTYYILIAGVIEEISGFTYAGLQMIWSKY